MYYFEKKLHAPRECERRTSVSAHAPRAKAGGMSQLWPGRVLLYVSFLLWPIQALNSKSGTLCYVRWGIFSSSIDGSCVPWIDVSGYARRKNENRMWMSQKSATIPYRGGTLLRGICSTRITVTLSVFNFSMRLFAQIVENRETQLSIPFLSPGDIFSKSYDENRFVWQLYGTWGLGDHASNPTRAV